MVLNKFHIYHICGGLVGIGTISWHTTLQIHHCLFLTQCEPWYINQCQTNRNIVFSNIPDSCWRYLFLLHSRSRAMAVILCFVSGPALMKVDPDGCDLFTDRDTPRDLSLCLGMVGCQAENALSTGRAGGAECGKYLRSKQITRSSHDTLNIGLYGLHKSEPDFACKHLSKNT